MTTAYHAKVRNKYSVEAKSKRILAESHLALEVWSINDLVERSMSEDEAMERFKGMHGFSMPESQAHEILKAALARKFTK